MSECGINIKLLRRGIDFLDEFIPQLTENETQWFPVIKFPVFKSLISKLFEVNINNECVGLVFITPTRDKYSRFGAYDISIILLPQFQGRGLAKDVVKFLIDFFVDGFFLVRKDNYKMLNLLRKTKLSKKRLINSRFKVFY